MYELYPEYSTIHDNYFFAQDERSPAKPPKLTAEEVEEARNDWFDGLRRMDQERYELMNRRFDDIMRNSNQPYNNLEEGSEAEECEAEDEGDFDDVDDVDDDHGVDEDIGEVGKEIVH
jgi:hypothetical protein